MNINRLGSKPCFHDGLQSYKTYLVVAAKPKEQADKYNLVGVRCMGSWYRVHAYPNFAYFGVPVGRTPYKRDNGDVNGVSYEGVHMTKEELDQYLLMLAGKRGALVVPPSINEATAVSNRGFKSEQDAYFTPNQGAGQEPGQEAG